MAKLLFSIITVCLNEEKNISGTLESILNQKSKDFEYIVKDGGSSDNTNIIIKTYKKKFKDNGIIFKHIIEKDLGIYDAMNHAVGYCEGSFVNFMNVGDSFYNPSVLSALALQTAKEDIKVLYGHTLFQISPKYSVIMNHSMSHLEVRTSICHQSVFYHMNLIKQYPFDCRYTIAADYDQLLYMKKCDIKFKSLNMIVSAVNRKGISAKNIVKLNYENNILIKKYGLENKKKTVLFISGIKEIIIKILPQIESIFFVKNQLERIETYRRT